MEVPPPTAGRILEEEAVATPSVASPGVEDEPPSGGVTEVAGQPMQGVQATQDPEASRLPVSQDPQLKKTPSPIKTMSPHLVLSKEPLGGVSLPIQAGESLFPPYIYKKSLLLALFYFFSLFFFSLSCYFLFSF